MALFVIAILFPASSYAEITNCADMYSNRVGLYMVSDSELAYDEYQWFWNSCYNWMIAWIWI